MTHYGILQQNIHHREKMYETQSIKFEN